MKDRLKQLLGGKDDRVIPKPSEIREHEERPRVSVPQGEQGANVGNFAEGFVSLINNALTQINANLSKGIEKRIESRPYHSSQEARGQSKSPPRKLNMPRLEEFRPPPTFNMNIVQTRPMPVAEEKIVPKDYSHLKLENNDDELYVSDFSKDEEDD